MQVKFAIVGLTMAVSAFSGVANAQTASAEKTDRPWYDRFTASAGLTDQDKGFTLSENRTALSFSPTAKWGVTFNVRDADRALTASTDETSLGAFYHLSPRLRVGGEVSVGDSNASRLAAPTTRANPADQASAGVKLESAFKF